MFAPVMLEKQVAPILKAHEDSLTNQVPSVLKPIMPQSPTQLFNDHVATNENDSVFKQKAGQALNALQSFVTNVKANSSNLSGTSVYDRKDYFSNAGIPDNVPQVFKAPMSNAIAGYQVPKGDPNFGDFNLASPQALTMIVGSQENQNWDPNPPIRHNNNGTFDMGLAQLNSAMVTKLVQPYFKNVLNKPFDITNAEDNLIGASVILNANAQLFKNITGRLPNTDELLKVYNSPATYAQQIKKAQQEKSKAFLKV